MGDSMNIFLLMMIFVVGGIAGWIYEIIFYYFNSHRKKIYMRGSNFLPFINVYSFGCVFLALITYFFKDNPLYVFLLSVLITGSLELLTGLVLKKVFNLRLWDYNKEILNFGNIGGYICLRSVLVFGIGGLLLVYMLIPILKTLEGNILNVVSVVLFIVFALDLIYNTFISKIVKSKSARDIYEKKGLKYLDF